MNTENTTKFTNELEKAYTFLFKSDPEYAYSAARNTPRELAEKMAAAFLKGEANKDGAGIKLACKAIGIKQTMKAISAYLRVQ
jgi:hypothetical protein